MSIHEPSWGTLKARYDHHRPRRMLALDGGGIRGLITLHVLDALETKLAKHYGKDCGFRLCQFFDYVAGTSTGAIIAAAIARGLKVRRILEFYTEFGKAIFTGRRWGIWNSLYHHGPLEGLLKDVYGDLTTLANLETLLLVVMRSATTDSAWPLSSNPFAKYNDCTRADCNLRVPLWQLVRASTAAPVYFPAEVITLDPANPDKSFAFVDGGTTAYNNPAFLLTRMATEPAYALGGERGEKNLLVVSVGTGEHVVLGVTADDPTSNLGSAALNTLASLMSQAAYDQDVNCRTVGRCTHGDVIDLEVWDLVPRHGDEIVPLSEDLGRSFLYARYNAALTREWLVNNGLGELDEFRLRSLAATNAMNELSQVGQKLGEQVKLEHFGSFVDQPLFVDGKYV